MIDNYKLYRSDRIRKKRRERGRDSGGVAIYLREDLISTTTEILKVSTGVIEILGLHVKSLNLVIIVVYRQPDDSTGGHRSTHKEFKTALGEIRKSLESLPSPSPDILLCGDFNLPHISWPDATPNKKATKEVRTMLEDLEERMQGIPGSPATFDLEEISGYRSSSSTTEKCSHNTCLQRGL